VRRWARLVRRRGGVDRSLVRWLLRLRWVWREEASTGADAADCLWARAWWWVCLVRRWVSVVQATEAGGDNDDEQAGAVAAACGVTVYRGVEVVGRLTQMP
jgi:hypothetical protein